VPRPGLAAEKSTVLWTRHRPSSALQAVRTESFVGERPVIVSENSWVMHRERLAGAPSLQP
jgi:hypothetical protein